jgi:Protein of unknown function (DUF3443)
VRFLFLFLHFFLGSPLFAPVFANEMPFDIGKDVHGFNTPYVSVTFCIPGTRECKTVDRIKLDTGSEGLRVQRSALAGLGLPISMDSGGSEIAMCADFGGGSGDWGPIAKADLFLGDTYAPGATVEVIDSTYPSPGVSCFPNTTSEQNGIIGMDTALAAPNGKSYFSCNSSGNSSSCTPIDLDLKDQPLNPITYMTQDSNGFLMRTPAVPATGLPNLRGEVIFGIGTAANNQPSKGLNVCHVRPDDFFRLSYNGNTYWTKFDSGTNSFNLPSDMSGIPFCQDSSVYLCPVQPVELSVELLNADGSECAPLTVSVTGNFYGPGTPEQSWVEPGLGEIWGGETSQMLGLGIPFFFGRDIYYVLGGRSSPLGAGPAVAFK